jgi:hypothetical protein
MTTRPAGDLEPGDAIILDGHRTQVRHVEPMTGTQPPAVLVVVAGGHPHAWTADRPITLAATVAS